MSDFGERESAGRSGAGRSGTARWCGCGSGIVRPWGWVDPAGGGDCGCRHDTAATRGTVARQRDPMDIATARPIPLRLYGGASPNCGLIHGAPLPEVSGAGGLLGSAERDTMGVMAGQVAVAPTLGVKSSSDYSVAPPIPVHTPVYPRRNANRAPRHCTELAVMIKVDFGDNTQWAYQQVWPNAKQATDVFAAINVLAKNNAYHACPDFQIYFVPHAEVSRSLR